MKKLTMTLCVILILLLGVCVWLLSASAPENAPSGEKVIDLSEKYPGQ